MELTCGIIIALIILWLIRQGKKKPRRKGIPNNVREYVLARDKYKCRYCGKKDWPMHVDHVIPVSRGGSDRPNNLVAACPSCNLSKGARTPKEWRRR